jgi:hypothetical protein
MATYFATRAEVQVALARLELALRQLDAAGASAIKTGKLTADASLTGQIMTFLTQGQAVVKEGLPWFGMNYPGVIDKCDALIVQAAQLGVALSQLTGEPNRVDAPASTPTSWWTLLILAGGCYAAYRLFTSQSVIPWERLPQYAGGGRA